MKVVALLVVVLLVFLVGCQGGVTVTTEGSVFYPECKTKDGGSFSDPGGRGHGFNFFSGSNGTKSIGNFGRDK